MNYSLKHLLLAGISMLAGTLAYAHVLYGRSCR